ncbi:MAG: cytochrome P450 [Boseongicola sp.]
MIPPKPAARPDKVSLWRYWQLFRDDILSAQPARLYRARMAEFRTPFFRSYLINEPELVRLVLRERPRDFPKSKRVTAGLVPLLGQSVFVTNGDIWERQRRIIDPAFEGGRIRWSFPSMLAAADAAADRIEPGELNIEALTSYATADVIFRTLFSLPIDDETATDTYKAFRAFQREQPVATLNALIPWLPVWHSRKARDAARKLRRLIRKIVDRRLQEIADGVAPDDLATKIMTTEDPETGECFDSEEMVDQVAIFFLAGHETSASLLGWVLWLLAASPEWGDRVRQEATEFVSAPKFSRLASMSVTRNVLRETLRLYPPVPMFVREAAHDEEFRGRKVKHGAQVIISPWHLHRHERIWNDPDHFDPARWEKTSENRPDRDAYQPFSSGPRACPGAGFAMAEAAILLAVLMARFRFEPLEPPIPVAHLTVRSRDGIRLSVS